MFRNEYTAKIGFTRVLDRTCPKDGGMYSSNEKSACPKCNSPLIPPTRKTDSGPVPYCFTEVTLYPKMPKAMQDLHVKRTEASKSLFYTIRMILWGRVDKDLGVAVPDKRSMYLVPKRTIRVVFNNPPQLKPFTAGDQSTKVEMKYTFDSRDGDQIEFLDSKQEMQLEAPAAETKVAESPAPTIDPIKVDPVLASMKAQLDTLTAALNKVLPAPNPADSAMSMDSPEDYQPDAETLAQEVNTDPFAA